MGLTTWGTLGSVGGLLGLDSIYAIPARCEATEPCFPSHFAGVTIKLDRFLAELGEFLNLFGNFSP